MTSRATTMDRTQTIGSGTCAAAAPASQRQPAGAREPLPNRVSGAVTGDGEGPEWFCAGPGGPTAPVGAPFGDASGDASGDTSGTPAETEGHRC